jgi:hypothetical protein
MLGLPVYVLAAGLLVPGLTFARRRLVRAAVVPALVLSAWCYWSLGVGPLTRGARWETLRTVRGTVRVSPEIARQYQALASVLRRLDPTGRRPLFTFGYASFNYFLGRPNPSSLTTGFRFTDRAPAQIIAGVLEARPRAFVMDNLYFTRGMLPVPELKLDTWRQPLQPSFYRVYDRPFFEALVAACGPEVATIPDRRGRPLFRLYDCRAQGNSAGAANR